MTKDSFNDELTTLLPRLWRYAFVQVRTHLDCLSEAVREWAERQPESARLGLKTTDKEGK